ncbi:MAG TPA: CBS domain-containing protein [Candidatus Bilamarchaeaceae archaeon]|nr:CBS domain-containing protein [Candidatus Bilamarchaeaceae archaeon]
MGSEIKVGDIMSKNVISVTREASIMEVAKLMEKYNVGSIVVADKRKAEGIITERDIVRKLIDTGKDSAKAKASDAMSSPLKVITAEASIETAAKAMREYRIKRLPVISGKNELVGLISEGDIMRVFPSIVDLLEERAAAGQ